MSIRRILDTIILIAAIAILVVMIVGKWTLIEGQQVTALMAFTAFNFSLPNLLYPLMVIGPVAIIVLMFLPQIDRRVRAYLAVLFGILQLLPIVWLMVNLQMTTEPATFGDLTITPFSFFTFWFWLQLGIAIALALVTIAGLLVQDKA